MRHGSLFSGIGGFDLAAEWMGWENMFHCEWNEFGQKILKYYWPNAKSYGDITKTDFTKWRGTIDILTGGFPCQPYSTAGKRKGKEDDRHLWPEMLRAIREISPRWVVGENVRGLTNWNGGLVFDEVQADLETQGYEVLPFLLPACGVNAPHRRDRIWFVAHSINSGYNAGREQIKKENGIQGIGGTAMVAREFNGAGISRVTANPFGNGHRNGLRKGGRKEAKEQSQEYGKERDQKNGQWNGGNAKRVVIAGDAADSSIIGQQGWITTEDAGNIQRESGRFDREYSVPEWGQFPTQSPVCSGNDGVPDGLDATAVFNKPCKPAHARTFGRWRNESIKGYGNAVVPQVVYQIFKTIEQYEAGT